MTAGPFDISLKDKRELLYYVQSLVKSPPRLRRTLG